MVCGHQGHEGRCLPGLVSHGFCFSSRPRLLTTLFQGRRSALRLFDWRCLLQGLQDRGQGPQRFQLRPDHGSCRCRYLNIPSHRSCLSSPSVFTPFCLCRLRSCHGRHGLFLVCVRPLLVARVCCCSCMLVVVNINISLCTTLTHRMSIWLY